jgi:hypothetical protein
MTTWQPIETAPKDGTHLLGYAPEFEHQPICTIEYSVRYKNWWSIGNCCQPTHWQPLPAPPSAEPADPKSD